MRPQDSLPQKTNIASFATTAVVVAFVAWLTLSAARQDSIFAPAPQTSPGVVFLAAPAGSSDALRPDGDPTATAKG